MPVEAEGTLDPETSASLFSGGNEAAPTARSGAETESGGGGGGGASEASERSEANNGQEESEEVNEAVVEEKAPTILKSSEFKKLEEEVEETKAPTSVKTPAPSKGTKNYEGLEVDDNIKLILNKMSTDAFEYTKARLVELQNTKRKAAELETSISDYAKNGVPKSWEEHPEAYRLSPEYTKTTGLLDQARNEKEYWNQQWARIEAGEQWQDYRVGADGKLVPFMAEPTAQAKRVVEDRIQEMNHHIRTNQSKVDGLASEFKGRITARDARIRAREDGVFPTLKDDAVCQKNAYYTTLHNTLKEEGLENNPLAKTFCKLYATHMDVLTKYNQLVAAQSTKAGVAADRTKAGPSSSEINKGASSNGKGNQTLSVAGFRALKEQG